MLFYIANWSDEPGACYLEPDLWRAAKECGDGVRLWRVNGGCVDELNRGTGPKGSEKGGLGMVRGVFPVSVSRRGYRGMGNGNIRGG